MSAEPLPDVLDIALEIAGRLEHLSVPYLIGGSLASSVHGEPRATMDVDVVADLRAQTVLALVAMLRPDYYVEEAAARAAVDTGGAFNAVHSRAGIKIDFFVAGDDAFEHERLRTRIAVAVREDPPRTLWMDTAEHTVLRKLEWFRRGGEVSDRQWRDVRAIIALQGAALDRSELARWAPVLGVSDLLERSLDGR
ncbi:MAG: hypothetical protein WD771_06590 [Gemmatimonadaceae bacterium]